MEMKDISVREFVQWASGTGREEMLQAISESSRYGGCSDKVIESVLDDHLATIDSLGVIAGAVRIKILVEQYAPACPSAPIVTSEALTALEARYDVNVYC